MTFHLGNKVGKNDRKIAAAMVLNLSGIRRGVFQRMYGMDRICRFMGWKTKEWRTKGKSCSKRRDRGFMKHSVEECHGC